MPTPTTTSINAHGTAADTPPTAAENRCHGDGVGVAVSVTVWVGAPSGPAERGGSAFGSFSGIDTGA